MTRLLLPALAAVLVLSACDSAGTDPQPVTLDVETATDIFAPTTGAPPAVGGRFALYSLRENRLVLSSSDADRADSASTAWDIGFRSTTIIFNGGASGPGQGAAQIVPSIFDELLEAPATGYVVDGANTACPAGTFAICSGSGNGWYSYAEFEPGNPAAGGVITPRAGRTIVLKTAIGTYAKLRITSYYQGSPDPATITVATPARYYSFEYVHQPDGSRNFQTTTPLP